MEPVVPGKPTGSDDAGTEILHTRDHAGLRRVRGRSETITLSVHHTLSAGVSYQLVLLMYDEDNQRAVYIPFDYPGS